MEKEFIPYEQALALKELGFDEECWCYFINDIFNDSMFLKKYEYFEHMNKNIECTLSPLYSQAFRWFREKYGLHSYIEGAYPWFRFYINSDDNRWEGFKHLTHEEAELECLKKLIEIVKDGENR